MVVDGITGIFAFVGSRSMGMPSTWTLVAGILILVFGILCLVEHMIAAISIGIVMGLGVMSAGINWITLALNA